MYFVIIIILFIISFRVVYKHLIKPLYYWKNKNIPIPIFGNFWKSKSSKLSFVDNIIEHYEEFPEESCNGIFNCNNPSLLARELDAIKKICIEDLEKFKDHKDQSNDVSINAVFSRNVLRLNGDNLKSMGTILSPTFTGSKLKTMFELISKCAKKLADKFNERGEVETDSKDDFTRYINDVAAECGLDIQCDSIEDGENGFYMTCIEVSRGDVKKLIRSVLFNVLPRLCNIFGIEIIPKSITSFLENAVKESMVYSSKNSIVRPDNLLMEARKKETIHTIITDEDIVAQAFIFLNAGYDTSSVNLCFIANELAIKEDVQNKLQKEIDGIMEKCHGKPTYEAVSTMKYLDMVVSESLKKWPPVFITERECTEEYSLESNGKICTLVKGDIVFIPIIGLQRDEQHFPEPEKFHPARFSDENNKRIVPYSLMPFGVGPRACIGSRFALLEIKVMMIYLLSKYDLVVTKKTNSPITLSKDTLKMQPDGGFWVGTKPRKI